MILLKNKVPFIVGAVLLLIGAFILLFKTINSEPPTLISTTAEVGVVRQAVSVSGVIKAEDTAALAFPVSGTVTDVLVRKGDTVATGTVLARLDRAALAADFNQALANLKKAEADLAELKAGTRSETKDVSLETIELKTTLLKNTETTQKTLVENAKRALLSNELTAYSDDTEEEATPPIISGTYNCTEEGIYKLEIYRSGTASGYSLRLSGLESGTYPVSFDQPVAFGTCGLRALFISGSTYGGSIWNIDIPNKKTPSYVAKQNAYDLAVSDAGAALAAARQELALAKATALDVNAAARPESLLKSEAAVAEARARLERTEAELNDRVLRAPFSGTILSVDILPGETVNTAPVINILSPGRYELTARIPEIDIGKLAIGQAAEVIFDTRSDVTLEATIDFLSPNATTIDGVAYYEARLALIENPSWLRSGLNADIDIIIDSREDDIRLPARFITKDEDGKSVVRVVQGSGFATTTIEVLLRGNDGFIAISGLTPGTVVVAP